MIIFRVNSSNFGDNLVFQIEILISQPFIFKHHIIFISVVRDNVVFN